MKIKLIVSLLVSGTLLFALVGCESQLNNQLPETDMPDKAFRPTTTENQETLEPTTDELPDTGISENRDSPATDEDDVTQNTLLPNPNIGQGLPSGAVPWTQSDDNVPPEGEETTGHNPDNRQWTSWNGTAR